MKISIRILKDFSARMGLKMTLICALIVILPIMAAKAAGVEENSSCFIYSILGAAILLMTIMRLIGKMQKAFYERLTLFLVFIMVVLNTIHNYQGSVIESQINACRSFLQRKGVPVKANHSICKSSYLSSIADHTNEVPQGESENKIIRLWGEEGIPVATSRHVQGDRFFIVPDGTCEFEPRGAPLCLQANSEWLQDLESDGKRLFVLWDESRSLYESCGNVCIQAIAAWDD